MVWTQNRRLLLAILVVTVLVGLAGCSTMSGGIPDEELDREQEYDDLRDRNATVAIDLEAGGLVEEGAFRAVFQLTETEEVEFYRSGLYQDQPLDVHSVRFWYPNGTVVTGSELDVERGQSRTTIGVPAENGTLAISGGAERKSFSLPNTVSGSYNVTLPEGYHSSSFLLGDVNPTGYDRKRVQDDREAIVWEEVSEPISIRYYHSRDVTIFYGVVTLTALVGGVALAWTYRRVKQLERIRKTLGADDGAYLDDGRRPPPGRR